VPGRRRTARRRRGRPHALQLAPGGEVLADLGTHLDELGLDPPAVGLRESFGQVDQRRGDALLGRAELVLVQLLRLLGGERPHAGSHDGIAVRSGLA
jgi:hypothetical protein